MTDSTLSTTASKFFLNDVADIGPLRELLLDELEDRLDDERLDERLDVEREADLRVALRWAMGR